MRAMRKGDLVLFYHSRSNPPSVAGLAKVVKESYPDPTQFDRKSKYHDPKSSKDDPRWWLVDVGFVERFDVPVPLPAIKSDRRLTDMVLVNNSRLSVQPVTDQEFERVAGHGQGEDQVSEFLLPSVKPYYEDPLVLTEGSGSWVRDEDGREYLDAFGGILTTSLGHCHPQVVEAVREQTGKLGHTSTLYVTTAMEDAARRLAAMAPGALKRSFFTNSGTEAVETAIGLARAYTGRTEVIALRGAYHGRSALTTTLTAQGSWRPLPSMQAGISHALAPYPYRCPFAQPCDERCAEALARDLEETILTTTNGRPAAFIAEPIQGVNGVVVPPSGYFRRAAEVIRRYGGLLVIDEVQTSCGRTGGHWFGIEHWGVVPDIIVVAKGIAAGLPVGATITTDEIRRGVEGEVDLYFWW